MITLYFKKCAYWIFSLYLQVERVTKKCDLPEDLIRHQYKDFMNLCPEGNMTKEKFLQLAEVRFKYVIHLPPRYLVDRSYFLICLMLASTGWWGLLPCGCNVPSVRWWPQRQHRLRGVHPRPQCDKVWIIVNNVKTTSTTETFYYAGWPLQRKNFNGYLMFLTS